MGEKKHRMIFVNSDRFWGEAARLDESGLVPLSLAGGRSRYALFYSGKSVLGYGLLGEDKDRVVISGFAVHQDYRRRPEQYGTRFIDLLKDYSSRRGRDLQVCALPHSVGFWEKVGFGITDHEPGEVWMRYVGGEKNGQ